MSTGKMKEIKTTTTEVKF